MSMNSIKRGAILAAATVLFLICAGIFLRLPPSLVDAVTGATPRSRPKPTAIKQPKPSATCMLYMNIRSPGLADEAIRSAIRRAVTGEPTAIPAVSLRLAVSDDDPFPEYYAGILRERLARIGVAAEIRRYDKVMCLSRALAGKYDLLLAPELPGLPDAEVIVLPETTPEKTP
jgi:hypothetical protein